MRSEVIAGNLEGDFEATQGRDKFKDAIRELQGAVYGVDPIVMRLQRQYV